MPSGCVAEARATASTVNLHTSTRPSGTACPRLAFPSSLALPYLPYASRPPPSLHPLSRCTQGQHHAAQVGPCQRPSASRDITAGPCRPGQRREGKLSRRTAPGARRWGGTHGCRQHGEMCAVRAAYSWLASLALLAQPLRTAAEGAFRPVQKRNDGRRAARPPHTHRSCCCNSSAVCTAAAPKHYIR